MCHTLCVTTHGGTPDGPYNPSSPSDGDADAHAASAPLPPLWPHDVGGLSQLSHDHDTDRRSTAPAQNSSVHHAGVPPGPATVPTRGRRPTRLTQARVWSRCHRAGWHAAPCPAPESPRDPSGVAA